MPSVDRAASIADLRRLARRRLPRPVFDFIDDGAGDERTLRDNEADLAAMRLMPRVAVDVAQRSAGTQIVGAASALPLVLAPTGLAGFFWPGGEQGAARAAAGIPFCLSTNSVASIEEVARDVPGGERWFQFYFLKDQALMHGMVDRARDHGYRVLCLTLDLALQGRRERDIRSGFTVPLAPGPRMVVDVAVRPAWLLGFLRHGVRFGNFEGHAPTGDFSSIAAHVAKLCDAGADWRAVERIAARWDGPVVVKGVLNPDDARRAVDLGAEAVIVSNHGGSQLDHVPSAVGALPGVVEAVAKAGAGRAQVPLDGGVRRGAPMSSRRRRWGPTPA